MLGPRTPGEPVGRSTVGLRFGKPLFRPSGGSLLNPFFRFRLRFGRKRLSHFTLAVGKGGADVQQWWRPKVKRTDIGKVGGLSLVLFSNGPCTNTTTLRVDQKKQFYICNPRNSKSEDLKSGAP